MGELNTPSGPNPENGAQTGGTEFERSANEKPPSLVHQIYMLLAENKKWWLIPIVAVFLLVGALLLLGGTAAAPFIYTIF